MMRLFKVVGVLVLLVVVCSVAGAEVRLFVDKHQVKVWDPTLKSHSILPNFSPTGWRTHNYLALVWNDQSAWVYDIRTHQWIPLDGIKPINGILSDNYALVWNKNYLAVYDAAGRLWIKSPRYENIKTPLISRGMAAALSESEFIVYDPILRKWTSSGQIFPENASVGDNLAVAWNAEDVYIYDTTMHKWVLKQQVSPQAVIIEDYKVSVFTPEKIYYYDAMSHRWRSESR